jgi:hypothetical protein
VVTVHTGNSTENFHNSQVTAFSGLMPCSFVDRRQEFGDSSASILGYSVSIYECLLRAPLYKQRTKVEDRKGTNLHGHKVRVSIFSVTSVSHIMRIDKYLII